MSGIISTLNNLNKNQLRQLFLEADEIKNFHLNKENIYSLQLSETMRNLMDKERILFEDNDQKENFKFIYNCICDQIIERFKKELL